MRLKTLIMSVGIGVFSHGVKGQGQTSTATDILCTLLNCWRNLNQIWIYCTYKLI